MIYKGLYFAGLEGSYLCKGKFFGLTYSKNDLQIIILGEFNNAVVFDYYCTLDLLADSVCVLFHVGIHIDDRECLGLRIASDRKIIILKAVIVQIDIHRS